MHSLLLSIRPEHAKKIFEGTKQIELRRVKPKLSNGDNVLIYVSSPTKALIGGFEVEKIIEGNPDQIWSEVNDIAGITESEFQKYYAGSSKAHGIVIKKTWALETPLDLLTLKKIWNNFHPPQSYRYVSFEEAKLLGLSKLCNKEN